MTERNSSLLRGKLNGVLWANVSGEIVQILAAGFQALIFINEKDGIVTIISLFFI